MTLLLTMTSANRLTWRRYWVRQTSLQPARTGSSSRPPLGLPGIGDNGKTVIRGGLGIYYDFQTAVGISDEERVSLGPRGTGRSSYFSGGIGNPLTNVPGVPQGTLLDLTNPTMFTGAMALQTLPTIRANLAQRRGDPNNRDFSVINIEADKQGSVNASNFPNPSGTHISLGVQREVARDLVVSADFVVRRLSNIYSPGFIDVNHFSSSGVPRSTPVRMLREVTLTPLLARAYRTDNA